MTEESEPTPDGAGDLPPLAVTVEQHLCTGDGLCVQYAPEVFEFDIDGLAYVKDAGGVLLVTEGARAAVPPALVLDVLAAARECPGECIHVVTEADGRPVAGPRANAKV